MDVVEQVVQRLMEDDSIAEPLRFYIHQSTIAEGALVAILEQRDEPWIPTRWFRAERIAQGALDELRSLREAREAGGGNRTVSAGDDEAD